MLNAPVNVLCNRKQIRLSVRNGRLNKRLIDPVKLRDLLRFLQRLRSAQVNDCLRDSVRSGIRYIALDPGGRLFVQATQNSRYLGECGLRVGTADCG
ncbi:hypothetical protein D3C81_1769320 [compost metagenome]